MTLEAVVQIVTIAGFVATAFSFLVLRPLNTTIARLEKTVELLADQIRQGNEHRHELEIRVAEIDQRAKSAHRRLDTFADFCRATHKNEMPVDVWTAIARTPRKGDNE
jgi:hypothetical protein